jgi:NADPH2:quinone reductase
VWVKFAVQLAALAGARVTALVRDVEQSAKLLTRLGAESVVDEITDDFELIVDAVGGMTFASAIEHLEPRGLVVNLATDSVDERVAFRAARFDRSAGATIQTFDLLDDLARGNTAGDLARLVHLLQRRKLVAPLELEAPWTDISGAIDALIGRKISGKAVLHITNTAALRRQATGRARD